jgi:hypothetical protein
MATTSEYTPLPNDVQRALLKEFEASGIDAFNESGEVGRFLRAVLYGEQGCGKTVLAAKLGMNDESGRKTLFLDAENSTEVFMSHPDLKPFVDVKMFPGVMELAYLLPAIEAKGVYGTIVVDSFTTASSREMKSIIQNEGFKRAHKEASTEQDYGLLLNRWTWLFDVAMRRKLNFILIGHVREPNDKEIQMGQKRRVSGTDNQMKEILSRVGNVFFMEEIENDKGQRARIIRTRTDGKVAAKTRINELPALVSANQFVGMIDNWRRGLPINPPEATTK